MPLTAYENLQPPPFLPPSAAGVARAAELLRAGEVVALPTETVYGLAAHALNEDAVRQIFTIKGRPLIDPLIVHGLDEEHLATLADFTPLARQLANAFWPGPLTLVLKKTACVPRLVTAGRETVAVRAPAHPLARAVLESSGLPLAAPSANPFGYVSPTCADHVRASFGAKVPWILDGGVCGFGLESTIVDVSNLARPPQLLRPGPITAEALGKILGQPVQLPDSAKSNQEEKGLLAPGLLARHYSPHTPFMLIDSTRPVVAPGERTAWVRLRRPAHCELAQTNPEVFWLSENGDLGQAAHGLYELLRRLDEAGFAKIHCELAPEAGLGITINDRLRRAAGRG